MEDGNDVSASSEGKEWYEADGSEGSEFGVAPPTVASTKGAGNRPDSVSNARFLLPSAGDEERDADGADDEEADEDEDEEDEE